MFTNHAQQRMQQRAINQNAVELVIDYGQELQQKGTLLYLANRKACTRMKKADVAEKDIERVRGIYVVVSDGRVVTVAHRTQPVRAI